MIKILLREAKEQKQMTQEEVKNYIAQYIKNYGLEIAPNITTPFALAVAFRESTFNPYAATGTKLGVFQVGKAAAEEIGAAKEYPLANKNLDVGINLGLRYLQRQHDFATKINEKGKYNNYALTYIAFNLGRQGALNVVNVLKGKIKPDANLISAISGQTEAFVDQEDDVQTVKNYYSNVVKAFQGI
jgi:membrane-bound lytic murein transglycosylase MltF